MKILYLRLVNSAGIWAAMSKEDIEINFTLGENDIIMLGGGNGSGKTTILSSLSPFPNSTNDSRKNFFRKGKEGFKEIHYLVDDKIYMIRHYVKKQTKSYISVIDYDDYFNSEAELSEIFDEGTELNENGGVTTFNECVLHYLGVTEDFFKISRIGSNVSNLIHLSFAERKKYIGKFLPSIEEYLHKHKVVNEKFKVLNKEIKFVSDEIMKLDSIENLQSELDTNESLLEEYTKTLNTIESNINKALGKVSVLDKDKLFEENDYENPYEKEYSVQREEFERKKEYLEDLEDVTLEEVNECITNSKNLIAEQTKEREKNHKEKVETLKVKDELLDKIKSKKRQIKGLDEEDVESLEALKKEYEDNISSCSETIEKIEEMLTNLGYVIPDNLDKSDINQSKKLIVKIKTSIISQVEALESEHKKILKKIISAKLTLDDLINILNENNKTIKSNSKLIMEETQKLARLNEQTKQKEILDKRPSTCTDDECPFIKNVLHLKNLDEDIKECKENIEKLKEESQSAEEDNEIINGVIGFMDNITDLYSDFNDEFNFLGTFNPTFEKHFSSLLDFVNYLINNNVSNITTLNINELSEYYVNSVEIDEYKKKLEEVESKLKELEKLSKIKKDLNDELEKLNSDYQDIEVKINNITQDIDDNTKIIVRVNALLNDNLTKFDLLSNFDNFKNEFFELESKYTQADKTLEQISKIVEQISNWKHERKTLKPLIERVKEQIDDVKLKISRFNEYTERKNNLDKKFKKYNLVKDALNPIKGIPVYFISDYLNKTKRITNDLLDISQNGKFAIDFDLDEKNFFIKVVKSNGDILEDIMDASQGEVSLTSVSISLALMEQSMSVYDIVYLDEVDGALDANNRKSFITMIDKQKMKLGCEQVFLISHNKEFDFYPMDLIVLDGHSLDISNPEFMSNKTIIFKK